MEPIYVTGHRNPDTDSIVSAMAYAALQNAIGERDYVPARLGHISDETQLVLDRFGFEPPLRIQTMRTQVRDLDYDTPPALGCAVTMGRAWDALQSDRSIPAIPVVHDDGTLYGMISPAEIAAYDMQTLSTPCVQDIPVFNLLSVLDGKIINDAGYSVDRLSGEVTIAVPQSNPNLLFPGPESIVIVGEQPRHRAERQLPDRLPGGPAGGAARDAHKDLHHRDAVRCVPRRANGLSCNRNFAHLPHGRSRGLPSERFRRRREGSRAEEPPPELSDFG